MQAWEAQGLKIGWVTLLVNDQHDGSPTMDGAALWKSTFGLTTSYVAPLTNYYAGKMVPGSGSYGVPYFSIVNPRTLVVEALAEGTNDGHIAKLETVANMNK